MATYKNITGNSLIVNDEYGIRISFVKDEERSGLSNYLENFTNTYQIEENILLRRIGDLDLGGIPSPCLERDNFYSTPEQTNIATQGVNWGTSGGLRGNTNDIIQTSFADLANDSSRLNKVSIRTISSDVVPRDIDSRYVGHNGEISVFGNVTPFKLDQFGPSTMNQGAGSDQREFETCLRITVAPYGYPALGYQAMGEDITNPIYGPLLILNKYYRAFGSITIHDDSGDFEDENIGFRIDLEDPDTMILTKDIPNAFTGFTAVVDNTTTTTVVIVPVPTTTFTFTRTGGEPTDTIRLSVKYALGFGIAEGITMYFSPEDGLRGWFTYMDSLLFYLSDSGVMEFRSGANPKFVSW